MGGPMKPTLTNESLMELLAEPLEAPVVDHLYSVGQIILTECQDRTKQLDAKAMSLTGYGAGVLALLVSAFANKTGQISPVAWTFIVLSAALVVVSVGHALSAVWIKGYYWLSDADWFGHGDLGEVRKLKKNHLLAIHYVKNQHERANKTKAQRLKRAYVFLASAGLTLAASLLLLWVGA